MNYLNIRKLTYKTCRKANKEMNINVDDWLFSPYTFLKNKWLNETAAVITYVIQNTPISPNFISLLYGALGIIGGVFLASGDESLIIAGIIIFFSKIVFDSVDGLLARIKKKTSELGDVLDSWGGVVGVYSFLIGFGMYLYNATQEIHFIYLIILIITIKTLDLRNYTYHHLMYNIYKNNKFYKSLKNNKKNNIKKKQNIPGILITLKNFSQSFLDERARTVDSIGLIILIELSYDKIILTNYIYYLIVFKLIAIFLGGFYLVYYKEFVNNVILKLQK